MSTTRRKPRPKVSPPTQRTPAAIIERLAERMEAHEPGVTGTMGVDEFRDELLYIAAGKAYYRGGTPDALYNAAITALRSQQSVPPEAQALVERLEERAATRKRQIENANNYWRNHQESQYVREVTDRSDYAQELQDCADLEAAADFIVRLAARIQEVRRIVERMKAGVASYGSFADEARLIPSYWIPELEAAITAALASKEGT